MLPRLLGFLAALFIAAGILTSRPSPVSASSYCGPLGPATGQLGTIDAGKYGAANVRSNPNGSVICVANNGTKILWTNATANSPTPGLSGVWRQVYVGYSLQAGWVVTESVDLDHSAPSAPVAATYPPGAVAPVQKRWSSITVNEGDVFTYQCWVAANPWRPKTLDDSNLLGHGTGYRMVWGWIYIDAHGVYFTRWFADGQQGPLDIVGSNAYIKCD